MRIRQIAEIEEAKDSTVVKGWKDTRLTVVKGKAMKAQDLKKKANNGTVVKGNATKANNPMVVKGKAMKANKPMQEHTSGGAKDDGPHDDVPKYCHRCHMWLWSLKQYTRHLEGVKHTKNANSWEGKKRRKALAKMNKRDALAKMKKRAHGGKAMKAQDYQKKAKNATVVKGNAKKDNNTTVVKGKAMKA